uniref:Uncharacterized protein n=1 Tax=Vitis vinifera TaxID=29760 RepID=A5BRY8_VITVI|nr:hypothetical protein VITISV_004402 [Vitis vinifera]
MVHPNDIEFRSYDTAGTLDKQYVLAAYHSFVKSGQPIQYLVSSKKMKDGFCMDNVVVVNGRGKILSYVFTTIHKYPLFMTPSCRTAFRLPAHGNAQVLHEELNLLWPDFLGMVFYMLLAFHLILINKTKGNYFRLVTLKTVHPNNKEFRSYDIAETLDKQYVLTGIQYLVSSKKLEDGFGMDNVAMVNGRGKLQDYVIDVFTTIHKHPLFMTPYCRTTFRLLAHGNAKVLDEELNLLWHAVLGMLEDEFGMDNVVVVNGRGKIIRLCVDNMGLDLQFIHNNIAYVLHDILNNYYGLEMNQTNDFRLLIVVSRDPRAFHE